MRTAQTACVALGDTPYGGSSITTIKTGRLKTPFYVYGFQTAFAVQVGCVAQATHAVYVRERLFVWTSRGRLQ